MIDLRSDTFTKPPDATRAAMAGADVGDAVYGGDPTLRAVLHRDVSALLTARPPQTS